jgi:hypothetical protein
MKRRAYPASAMPAEISNHFLRGFLTTGLLSTVARKPGAKDKKAILRHALQGGTALAAGVAAANALQRGELGRALLAAAIGATGLAAIEHTLNDSHQDTKGSEA